MPLDVIERVGNKVPHPVLMFLYLIIGVIVLSAVLAFLNVSVTERSRSRTPSRSSPTTTRTPRSPSWSRRPGYEDDWLLEETTIPIESLLSIDGMRFIFTSFVPNFTGFAVVAVTFVALMGAGVAEAAGLMDALIRLLVGASPRRLLAFILIFVGVLSSVASDAGYLILVPLGAAAFVSVGRHPLAGMAACFAGVGAIFGVNPLLGPIDAMMTEITNEALGTGQRHAADDRVQTSSASCRRSCWPSSRPSSPSASSSRAWARTRRGGRRVEETDGQTRRPRRRGLRYALFGFLGFLALVLCLTLPAGAPLRDPVTGDIIGTTPFMDSLLFIITMVFLLAGIGYGFGAGTFKSRQRRHRGRDQDLRRAGRPRLHAADDQPVHRLLQLQPPAERAGDRPGGVARAAGIGALPLLIGMIVVILVLDLIMPGLVPKWAIFAPIFVPLFIQLGIPPQTVLAAYRVGDSPLNVVTPLMVYLPFIVTIAQRYQKDAGIGTIIALMLPVRRHPRARLDRCCSSCGSCWVCRSGRAIRSRLDADRPGLAARAYR